MDFWEKVSPHEKDYLCYSVVRSPSAFCSVKVFLINYYYEIVAILIDLSYISSSV